MNGSRRAPTRARGLADAAAGIFFNVAEEHDGKAWPAAKWRDDPNGFARTILGVELWSAQIEFLEAIRDNARVSVAGGRKIGKDYAYAVAALWWYASWDLAKVFMTATTAAQIDDILYLQIRQLFAASGKCVDCKKKFPHAPAPCPHSAVLTGSPAMKASTGIKAHDFRRIYGRTADDPEALAGISGDNQLVLVDEASLYPDKHFVSLVGNLAGANCKIALISNPTQNTGFFFDSHHHKKDVYATFRIPSTDSPNVVEHRHIFPGLATDEKIEEFKQDWGEDSPEFAVHVKAEFPINAVGQIFSVHARAVSVSLWPSVLAEGRLHIGVDPAGEGGKGDECGFAARQGKKVHEILARRALTPEGHVLEVVSLIAKYPTNEPARVIVDREGETGAKVWGAFVTYVQQHEGAFDLVGVRSSERPKSTRQAETYDRVRDALCASLADWMRDGGAIPEDRKLDAELGVFRWFEQASNKRSKTTSKDEIRKILGRSPDRADALMLSTWGQDIYAATAESAAHEAQPQQQPDPYASVPHTGEGIDPYATSSYGSGR